MEPIILHADLNSFYASVECLYDPSIRDKPVAVCGSPELRHGIVLAKNELAKKAGIKTGEVIWEAKIKAPNLLVVPPKYDRYLRIGNMAREIYGRYSQQVEPFGMDEAWIDISYPNRTLEEGYKIAWEIKEKIKFELGITASIGVSFNKIFAKLGSDMKKPDAVTLISRDNYKQKAWPLPVEELLYVGRATKRKLNRYNIHTIGELAQCDREFLQQKLGKWGPVLRAYALGQDFSRVENQGYQSVIKSIGNGTTPPEDLNTYEDVKITVLVLAESVARRLREQGLKGKTVQIYVRDCDLESFERQGQLLDYSNVSRDIAGKALEILKNNWLFQKPIRSFSLRVTNLVSQERHIQLSLFEEDNKKYKLVDLEKSIDQVRSRYGAYAVQRACLLETKHLGDISSDLEASMREVSFNVGEKR